MLLAAGLVTTSVAAQDRAGKIDRFAPLRFLAGSWRGEQSGQPGRGTAERTYQFILVVEGGP